MYDTSMNLPVIVTVQWCTIVNSKEFTMVAPRVDDFTLLLGNAKRNLHRDGPEVTT